MPTLSVVVPAYNEARFIGTLLAQVRAVDLRSLGVSLEIVVVDDCSTDATSAIAAAVPSVRVHRLPANQGKGRAVRAGIEMATGEYLIIQDADLEYDPQDYVPMVRALLEGRGDVVYGSRYLGRGRHAGQSWAAYLGGRSLSVVGWMCTGRFISDTVTALKLFPRSLLLELALETTGFETDHEITARLIRGGFRVAEVPITYHPRSVAEGKKIKARDGLVALWTLLRFRFSALRGANSANMPARAN